LEIVQDIEPNFWMHLHRKKRGSEVAMKYGRTLDSVFAVKNELDLERVETAQASYIDDLIPKKADI
jgi:hypothetical protein